MLKLLLKKQLLEIFQVYYYDAKKNKARSKVSTVLHFLLFALLVFGLLGGIFTFLAVKLCPPLLAADMDWLYFALMGLISVLLGAFGSVFNTYAGVYLPKDNDLLLSMPIPVSALVGARLAGVYLMGLLYSAVVILPAVLVYWVTVGVTLPAVLGGLLLTLLISIFVLTISCMLGWMVARISQKLKHKSLITVLVSLAVIGVYYFVYFRAQTMIQQLMANAAVYGAQIKGIAYPVYLFGSVGVGDVRASIIISAAVAALFGLMWVLLSHSFLQIATATGKVTHREYRETRSRQRSTNTALLCREFSRFAASPSYMLNCGLGTFLMPVCGGALLWKGGELFAVLDAIFAETPDSVPFLLCVVLCSLASMNFMTAPSVSLEGKSLWLLQSLPVGSWRIFQAKIRMQLLLTGLPLLLCIGCTAAVYPLHPMQILMLLLFASSYTLLMALVGLFFGVKMPTLTWTGEIMPIKQGVEVWSVIEGQQRFDSHIDKLMNYIRYWQASGESIKTSIRTRTRIEQLTEEGHYTGGIVAFGYKRVQKGRLNKKNQAVCDLEINEEEAAVVRLIFQKYVYEGYGAKRICNYLVEHNIMGRNGKNIPNITIGRMIRNKGYTGYLINGNVEKECPELRIIEPEVFERAQELRDSRRREKGEDADSYSPHALLCGKVFCAHCGNRLNITSSGRTRLRADGTVVKEKRYRYSCNFNIRHPGQCDGQSGYGVTTLDAVVESIVCMKFEEILECSKSNLLEEMRRKDLDAAKKEATRWKAEVQTKVDDQNALKKEMIRVIQGTSGLDREMIQQMVNENKEALLIAQTNLADSEKKLKEIEEQNQKAERNCSDLFTWASTYKGASFERRQAILKQFIKEVRVGRDYNIEIVLNVPLDEFEEFKRHAASAGGSKNQKNKSQNPQKVGRCTSNAGIVVLDKTAGETISIVPKNAAHAILRC